MRVWPGTPYPLGATWDGEGVNFALFSENATGVELGLFEQALGGKETAIIPIRERTHDLNHATQHLAEVMMNRGVREALAGKNVKDV